MPESKKNLKSILSRDVSKKDTEINLKRLSLAKSGTIWPSKYLTVVTDYNRLNKTGNMSPYRYKFNE